MLMLADDRVSVREGNSRTRPYFKNLPEIAETKNVPVWLDRDVKNLTGKVVRLPERTEIDGNLNEQLIVEYYSR